MPNKRAAIKGLRQNKKRRERNKSTLSEIKTLTKKARTLISAKNKNEADTVLKTLESKLSRAVKSKTLKKGCASRRIKRLRSQWAHIKSE